MLRLLLFVLLLPVPRDTGGMLVAGGGTVPHSFSGDFWLNKKGFTCLEELFGLIYLLVFFAQKKELGRASLWLQTPLNFIRTFALHTMKNSNLNKDRQERFINAGRVPMSNLAI